jgi:hypothetical protein
MASNELAMIWQQLDDLHQAIIDLTHLQRAALDALQSQEPGTPTQQQPVEALGAISTQLDHLCERLEQGRQAVEQQTARLGDAEELRVTEIATERINVIDPDGKVRLTLCNARHSPGHVMDGKIIGKAPGQREAGIFFFDEEGNECGGLIYGGKRDENGYYAGSSLTFDQYRQDQVIGLQHEDANGQRSTALRVWDRPDMPLDEWIERFGPIFEMPDSPERQDAIQRLQEAGLTAEQRVFVGRGRNKDAAVCLYDARGRLRIRLAVSAAGTPVLQFLDDEGKVAAEYPGEVE